MKELAQIITSMAALIAAVASLGAVAVGLNSQRAIEDAVVVTKETQKVVEEVHIATNSMKDELVKATREAALLTGHKQGVADEKQDQKDELGKP